VPDIAAFHTEVMHILIELAESVRSLARCNDVVQLELVSEKVSRHITVPITDEDNVILPAFEESLE